MLVNRQSGKHPVMVGPQLVHQKKETLSFKLLVDFLVDQEPRLKNLRALRTDGETTISLAFKGRCVILLVLFCAIHLRRHVTDKMVALGIEDSERGGNLCRHLWCSSRISASRRHHRCRRRRKIPRTSSSAARSVGDNIWSERQGVPLVV